MLLLYEKMSLSKTKLNIFLIERKSHIRTVISFINAHFLPLVHKDAEETKEHTSTNLMHPYYEAKTDTYIYKR